MPREPRRLYEKASACFRRDLTTDLSSRWSFALQGLHLAFAVISYYFLATQVAAGRSEGYPAFPFLLIGVMVQGYMTTVLVMFAQVVRGNQIAGTFKAVLTTRTSPVAFVLLSSLYPLSRTTIDVAVYLLVGLLLGFSIGGSNVGGALLVFVLSLVAFGSLGIVLAALSLVSNRANTCVTLVVSASWLMSGGLYPREVLPSLLENAANLLPATYALNGLRATLIGNVPTSMILPDLAALALFSILAVPVALVVFDVGLKRARVCGTLGHI
jgi:ABC-2 type transport system permease protein